MASYSFLVLATMFAAPMLVLAQEPSSAPTPSNAPCPGLPGKPDTWKEQEHWVWKEVCEGREADLIQHARSVASEGARDYAARRDLTQRFLATILFDSAYESNIPRQGVAIIGARFREEVNLANARLKHDLKFYQARFERKLNMRRLEAERSMSFLSCSFGTATQDDAVDLAGARVGGSLNFEGARASGHFNMDSLNVGEVLAMRSAIFTSVWLANAKVVGEFDMSDTTVRGELRMSNLEVGKDLKLRNPLFTTVILRSATIGGELAIEGPKNEGPSYPCPNRQVPRPKEYPAQSIDLTEATVGKALTFGSECYGPIDAPRNWGTGALLILRNAHVHTLQDGIVCGRGEAGCQNTWPGHLELDGLVFQQLGSPETGERSDMAARPVGWWTEWLGKQPHYSPQPYEYLASALVRLGYKDKAKDILYAGKERELESAELTARVWLWLERAFIGYGYRTYYALGWVVGFIILGAVMLRLSGEGPRHKMPYGLAFSLDMILPIIKLREYHHSVDLRGWVRYYFYFHRLMGYVLASFLIAGLSGLTK